MEELLRQSSVRTVLLTVIAVAFVLFSASLRLFHSPETWMDEGLIIQSAIGLMHTGKASLPVAPGMFEPAWYITTGFPVTLPLATVFSFSGVSLPAARIVMWVFLLLFYATLVVYARTSLPGLTAWLGIFLLITFGPLYGNGRNVLGEIPGLLCMLLALLPLVRAGPLTKTSALWIGIWAGLAVATKPIFVLFLPALLLSFLLNHRTLELRATFWYGVCGIGLPLVVWAFLQFDAVTIARVLAVYVNPHDVAVGDAIATNLKRFFTELMPLYFLGALIVWGTSYSVRRVRKESVPVTEEILFFFSVLIFLAYLRTAGFYRYFFLGQVYAVLYLPHALLYLTHTYNRRLRQVGIVLLGGILCFQTYETLFRSWTAIHYESERTNALTAYFAARPQHEEVLVYQAPEVVPFAVGHPVSQYARITPSISFGDSHLPGIRAGKVSRIITTIDAYQAEQGGLLSRYQQIDGIDNYVVLVPKKTEHSSP